METGLVADLSVVHAWKADTEGNLVFRKTSRNFQPDDGDGRPGDGSCSASIWSKPARSTPIISIRPGIFVQRIVHLPADYEKRIEKVTTRPRAAA